MFDEDGFHQSNYTQVADTYDGLATRDSPLGHNRSFVLGHHALPSIKHRAGSARSAPVYRNISMACVGNGTTCSRRAFMRRAISCIPWKRKTPEFPGF